MCRQFLIMCDFRIILKVLLISLVCPVNSQYYFRHQLHSYGRPSIFRMPPPPPHPRQVRQTPYYVNLNAQRYTAVPGQIIQQFNTAPLPITTVPARNGNYMPLRNTNFPLRNSNVPLRNMNVPVRNSNVPVRNSNVPQRNVNTQFRNVNTQFRNANTQFRNVNAPFRNVNVPLLSPFPLYYEIADSSSSNPDGSYEEEEQNNGGGLEPPPPESESQEPPPPPESDPQEPPPPESAPQQPPPMMMEPPPPPPPDNDNDNGNDEDGGPPPQPPPQHNKGKLIHKHISIHTPPDDFEDDDQVTVIRPKNHGPEKHVNIIFIKAPSMKSNKKKTEVILPDAPEQKTLVYVLVKKPDPANDGSIKVLGPAPTKPSKPLVYFIRYKQKNQNGHVYTEKKHHHHYHHH